MGKERLRPVGDFFRLRSVLCISVSALTLLVGLQEGHSACNNLCHLSPKVLFQYEGRKKPSWNWITSVHLENIIYV